MCNVETKLDEVEFEKNKENYSARKSELFSLRFRWIEHLWNSWERMKDLSDEEQTSSVVFKWIRATIFLNEYLKALDKIVEYFKI